MSNVKTGKIYIKLDGTLYESMAGAKLSNPFAIERKPVVGAAVYGYTETAARPRWTPSSPTARISPSARSGTSPMAP